MLERAHSWLLRSGIQEASGGVARYYRTDCRQNAPISAEITGYAVSTLVYLHPLTGQDPSLEGALRAAQYLTREGWDSANATFPFEPGSQFAYFFDIGIIARGLLAAWRVTGEEAFLARANDAALSLAFDFLGEGVFHPVITLPDKQPMGYDPERWSRSPGCYQLKSALCWRDLGEAAGDREAARMFEVALSSALQTHESFLPDAGETDGVPDGVMDRLHAYCYFLEGLLSAADRPDARQALGRGIGRVGALLRQISPRFERSDVCAQLLRLRLIAHHLGAVPLDRAAAADEAGRAVSYQASSPNPRLDGGFWFGRRDGALLPFLNPVSTGFSVQALTLWQQHQAGDWRFELNQLI